MIDELLSKGASVVAYDPEAMNNVKEVYGSKITFSENQYEALKGADALLIATEWSAFRNPDWDTMKKNLNEKLIFDGRNLFELDEMKDKGFYYESIGRKTILPR